ncbi:DUF4167 domain-containing protein [Defluviimonas sp. WL0024]|uniref:DUF4167 domain-containing protein n=2 Tax=Albidovulum TaxID=205889 RepID=A0ABT3IXE8_9RHOB|nr:MULTISPECIES: DUF4167 domain-containing protein [Defluviimonas]MCU9846472.1 DUF4167 domain-containing protein [Defluviimonas sp. WL0024]MCW3780051.1 DUF4167 domain-containing protein [Defluviimonas salinarum]
MRSSKSRSRSKSNRQRSLGNIVNRVFDSSGPEGKVRGTPQQIIDKYLTLARDAQLSNDRVAEQNFLQHAEHYTRMLGEAQREMSREQEQRQQQGEGGNGPAQPGQGQGGNGGERQNQRPRYEERNGRDAGEFRSGPMPTARDEAEDDGPGLVETPESSPRAMPSATMMPELPQPTEEPAPAAEKKTGRGSRGPRKPREKRAAEPKAKDDTPGDGNPVDVAE